MSWLDSLNQWGAMEAGALVGVTPDQIQGGPQAVIDSQNAPPQAVIDYAGSFIPSRQSFLLFAGIGIIAVTLLTSGDD